ncbi:Alpha/Beta hydrolase protein [Mycena maculata]|uniref:Alpha/Beta hydrolase protein n=1 Tax=Mycena maculata TaxID=230809 RepID=A0AAD7ID79_9AGAR|nr:Alpha/Beta hydrolase protein [Mycena maculata]
MTEGTFSYNFPPANPHLRPVLLMQEKPQVCRYGAWPTPVTPAIISDQPLQKVVAYEAVAVDPADGTVYHTERRLVEGRSVLVDSRRQQDLIPTEYNCRSVVHGYGGAPIAVRAGTVFFTNVPDMRIYKMEGSDIKAVTPATPQFRFANLTLHPTHPDLMVAIREDHSNPSAANVVDTVVSLNLKTGKSKVIVEGSDFYANPVFNARGTRLAWLRWNHPDMPFRSTELVVGDVEVDEDRQISISNHSLVAGGPRSSLAQQALWMTNNKLIFMHDMSGWMQPWIHVVGGYVRPVLRQPVLGEFAEPMWGLGMSSYAILDDDHLLCVLVRKGFASLVVVSISGRSFEELSSDFVDIKYLKSIRPNQVVFVGCKIDAGEAIVQLTLERGNRNPVFEVLVSSSKTQVPDGFAARPEPLVLADSTGHELHALFFQPTNPEFVGPPDERPPCVMNLHAGPTARTTPQFLWDRILYTSRGWAWLDVMYSGSSGYGRQYMERLDGKAAELDVQDCVEATRHTAAKGLIDIDRIVITGSSGPSVLMSLINFPDFYAAAASRVSVCDIAELYRKAPKLQLFYAALLLGGSPDELPDVYRARSPLFHADRIKTPVLLAHGKQDLVIPVEQTDVIVDEIKKHGGQVEYLRFEDEGHGFRRAANIRLVQERQLAFFEKVFGFGGAGETD